MKQLAVLFLLFALILPILSCASVKYGPPIATIFVTGEDAPLSSVVGFTVTINSITLNGISGTPATLLSNATTVNFARLIGLRSPLAFNTVQGDSYSSATITLSNPMISTVDSTTNPPTVNTQNGTLTQASVTVTFPAPLVVGNRQLGGVKLEFDIQQSLAVDGNGQITGSVNPVIFAKAIQAGDTDAQITELAGTLSTVDSANKSFSMQAPYGNTAVVRVTNTTQFNGTNTISTLATPGIVAAEGSFSSNGSFTASSVEVINAAPSFLSGRVLATTTNASGQVQMATLWVEDTSTDLATDAGKVMAVDVSQVSQYDTCFLDAVTTAAVFSNTSVIAGQRVLIGGTVAGSAFTPTEISLRRQGVYGMLMPGSVTITNGNAGSFQLQNGGLAGFSAAGLFPVNTGANSTLFGISGGLPTLQASTTAVPLITRGLIFKDPSSGNPAMWASWVAAPNQ